MIGAMIAVAEAVVTSRARVLTIGNYNCLNFGNPYNPEVYWQFVQAVKGMGAACERFDTPVTGGNVSFYNQAAIGIRMKPFSQPLHRNDRFTRKQEPSYHFWLSRRKVI
jgi:phosphoribosylformylglycinamidine synthase